MYVIFLYVNLYTINLCKHSYNLLSRYELLCDQSCFLEKNTKKEDGEKVVSTFKFV